MKPNLPRQLLWTEVRTMNEFLNDDITNTGLYHIVKELPQELLPEGSDIVMLFNEMYYIMTRFYYEEPKVGEYMEYQKTIINDLKWTGCSDLVLIMMFTYFRHRELQPKPAVAAFMKYMEKNFWWSYYWPHFINYTSSILRYPPSKFDPKVPHPVHAKELIGVKLDFETITCNHNFEAIQEIVNLWTGEESRKIIAKILLDDVSKYSSSFITDLDEIKNWLDSIIDDDNKKQVVELQKRIESLTAVIEELRQRLKDAEKLDAARIAEIDKWHSALEEEEKRTYMCESLQEKVDMQEKTIKEMESNLKPDEAFNSQNGQPCFTSRQMGILMTAVGKLTEKENPPKKTTIGDVVEKISGYSSTTVNQNMKGKIPDKDIKTIVSVLENKLPNLAAEIRKF